MYSQVINYIKQRIQISRQEIEESLKYSDFKKFVKGDYILRAGEHCRFIGFLNKGFIVTTFVDQTGNELASEFEHEGCFFTYTEGLANNNPSHKNFIGIEDCETFILKKEYLPVIFKANPKFETLFSQILAEELRNVLLNEQNRKTMSVEERVNQRVSGSSPEGGAGKKVDDCRLFFIYDMVIIILRLESVLFRAKRKCQCRNILQLHDR